MDKLFISPDTDQCHVCDKNFTHKRYNVMLPIDVDLVEVCFKTCHPRCQTAYKKMEKAKEKLLDAEFKLFLLKYK